MTGTMKAAVAHRFGRPLIIERVPIPEPGVGQVLIRVAGCGVCHTDIYAIDGIWPVKPNLPFIPGHEVSGTVTECGAGVASIEQGDRVGVPWIYSTCGACDSCLSGWENLCPKQENTGYSVDGGYAEYLVAPASSVVRLPDTLDLIEAAPLLCAGVTPYKGLKETGARPGQWVVVSGVGGLGHVAVQYAKAMGLHIAAVDIVDEQLALAQQLGAELVVNAAHTDPAREVRRQISGAHAVLITAVSPLAFQQGIGMLRRGGSCVLVGLPSGSFPVPIHSLVAKGLTIRGSTVGTHKDLIEALQFAAEGKVKAVVEAQPVEAINAVLERLRQGSVRGRVVLRMS